MHFTHKNLHFAAKLGSLFITRRYYMAWMTFVMLSPTTACFAKKALQVWLVSKTERITNDGTGVKHLLRPLMKTFHVLRFSHSQKTHSKPSLLAKQQRLRMQCLTFLMKRFLFFWEKCQFFVECMLWQQTLNSHFITTSLRTIGTLCTFDLATAGRMADVNKWAALLLQYQTHNLYLLYFCWRHCLKNIKIAMS